MLQCMSSKKFNGNALLTKTMIGVRCESTAFLSLWQTSYRQQVELCRHSRRCLSRNVHNLHAAPSRRIWWFIPPFSIVLAYSDWFRHRPPCMGIAPGDYAA